MTPARTLANCPSVIFIAYTVGADAAARGYGDWLRRVDNPFFNAIDGVRHYANWRVEEILHGGPLAWDYFDFQGLAAAELLETVWFDPGLDAFRREWVRLWGYGRPEPLPVHAHSYVMRPVLRTKAPARPFARIAGGRGEPAGRGDIVFRVEGVLSKHFTGAARDETAAWLRPAGAGNPLGLDWISVQYGEDARALKAGPGTRGAGLDMIASLIAAPMEQ